MTCFSPRMRLTLFFNRAVFQSGSPVVSSLRIGQESTGLLSLVCVEDGQPATQGDLELNLDLGLDVDSANDVSAVAVKGYSATAKRFQLGPVVSGLRSSGSNVLISGGSAGTGPAAGYRGGLLTIAVLPGLQGEALPIDVVKLDGATEEAYRDVLAIGFPKNKRSAFRGRVRIPQLSGVSQLTVAWYGWLFGKRAGSLPPLTFTYRLLEQPAALGELVDLPEADTDGVLDTSELPALTAAQYVAVESDAFSAAPGDIVLFTIERPNEDADEYADEVHVLNQLLLIKSVVQE